MQVVTDTSAPKDFSTIKRDIMLCNDKAAAPLSATVMSKDEALRANDRRIFWLVVGIIGFAAAFLVPMSWLSFADGQMLSGGLFLGCFVVLAALSVVMSIWNRKYWRRTIDKRIIPLPSAGTSIRFDEQTFSVAGQATPLSALQLDLVHLRTAARGKRRIVYEVERLTMTTPHGSLVLDALCMTNGQVLIDNVYRCIGPAGWKVG